MFELVASIKDNPVSAALGCMAIPLLVVWGIAVVHWMVMGDVDVLVGIVALMVAAGMGLAVMSPSNEDVQPLALGGTLTLMIVYPFLRRQLDKRALALIDIEQIESAYDMLALRPDNASAMFNLAEKLYYRGLVSHALGIGQEALANLPTSMFPHENRALQKWRAGSPPHLADVTLPCLDCGHKNGPTLVFCESCGSPYLAVYARGRWLGKKLALRLLASWLLAVIALVGLPLTITSVESVPTVVGLCSAQVSLALILVWRAFLYKEKTS